MEAKKQIQEALAKASEQLKITSKPNIELTSNENFGDFSTNIALTAAKETKKNPRELAEEIVNLLNKSGIEFVEKIDISASGFINFWISKDYIITQLDKLIDNSFYALSGKKIIVEFTDPNPFKEFHVGHLYNNAIGEAISRLLETSGGTVRRVNYQGDVGLHVAKAIWGMKNLSKGNLEELSSKSVNKKANFLGKAYALGAKEYEENENTRKEITDLNIKIYNKDKQILDFYEKGKKWSLEYFDTIYKRLGTKFDKYYFESEVGPIGLALVKKNIGKVFKESEGAIIYEGEKEGLHNRVFVNSQGLPTYEAKELALPSYKYKDFPYDESIVVTGNEITEYFKVVMAALKKIEPSLAKKTRHITHGMVRLPSGKMSSRLGNVVSYDYLLKEIKERLIKQFPEMEEDTLEQVTVGAVKYTLLKTRRRSDMEFNFDKSVSLDGDSAPYLQYTYARTKSIEEKAKGNEKTEPKELNNEELLLLRTLERYPSVLENAVLNLAPNTVSEYLFDLAKKFNLFYQKHRILESESESLRLKLTKTTGSIIKNGLEILGIKSPERM